MDVEIKLTGTLAARTGTHRARIGVPEDATIADVVETLSEQYGPQVRMGVLDDGRLRSDTVVVRETESHERLSAGSPVEPGDVVSFQISA